MISRLLTNSTQGVIFLSVALQLATLIQRCRNRDFGTNASIPAAALGLVAICAVAILSPVEHRTSYRPSSYLIGYLFVIAITEATRARTYFLMSRTVEAAIVTSDCILKVLLISLEGRKKLLIPEAGSKAPEDLAGPISQALFLWLNNLFLAGYQRAFVSADLERISSPLYTKSIFPRFARLVKGDIGKLLVL